MGCTAAWLLCRAEWLFGDAPSAARLSLFGPLGKATFHPSLGKNILCIAGGSGIAGMMAILAHACQERRKIVRCFGLSHANRRLAHQLQL